LGDKTIYISRHILGRYRRGMVMYLRDTIMNIMIIMRRSRDIVTRIGSTLMMKRSMEVRI
jgi:hypothetical protein